MIDPPNAAVPEHAHDWPVLSVYVAGSLENVTEAGTRLIEQPWTVLYGPRAAHANTVGENGFEQIEIEFDPDWLNLEQIWDIPDAQHWLGGRVSRGARDLARLWTNFTSTDFELMLATKKFLTAATQSDQQPAPSWVSVALARLKDQPSVTAAELAEEVGLSPEWLAQSYRTTVGEGIRETARRIRVERAATMLRNTDVAAADVAAECGFCDQSHMIRCFRRVLGSTPSQIRSEWLSPDKC